MASQYSTYSPRSALGHKATSPSPLRHASTASSNSSSSAYSAHYPPSRTSTVSSHSSNGMHHVLHTTGHGHKRGMSDATGLRNMVSKSEDYFGTVDHSPSETYQSARQSLRPLPQTPAKARPPVEKSSPQTSHNRTKSHADMSGIGARFNGSNSLLTKTPLPVESPSPRTSHSRTKSHADISEISSRFDGSNTPSAKAARPLSMATLTRSDSMRGSRDRPNGSSASHVHFSPHVERPDLQTFQKSTTRHLRTLSKIAQEGEENLDFTIKSREQEVAGLHGRRRLQRSDSVKPGAQMVKPVSAWGASAWIDAQRQFLQAYEYLCHIGEAKEWIEDILQNEIPPIVHLEEALRDGVTFAEIVQALKPGKPFRIFRHPKLQFRHSDNIALFFNYLHEVELPELFRFELVDLYEKKNIPKVIYCIHALSWLLYRKGIVDFRIGNLVGQLQFADHELEETQKGLDKSGVAMPNFSGMSANFGEPEPEPEPVETDEERINRELAENEQVIVDLQAQIRGATTRLMLGDTMQVFWDNEDWTVDLQARIRGDFARQIFEYRMGMYRSAVELQSAIRGYLARSRLQRTQQNWERCEKHILQLQSLIRAKAARADVKMIKTEVRSHEHGIRDIQAAIRGALARAKVADQYEETRDAQTEQGVQWLQAAVRGMLARKSIEAQMDIIHDRRTQTLVTKLQAAARGQAKRRELKAVAQKVQEQSASWVTLQSQRRGQQQRHSIQTLKEELSSNAPIFRSLQACCRGAAARKRHDALQLALKGSQPSISLLQCSIRGYLLRSKAFADKKSLQAASSSIVTIQAASKGYLERQRTYDIICELENHDASVTELQAMARGMLSRISVGRTLTMLDEVEDTIVALQAHSLGMIIRQRFAQKKRFYEENMKKVVKIQSFVRGKQQGQAYKTLVGGKNPPVGTVKNFVHLLNDSDLDFEEEIEMERLRKTVVQHVRQNEMAEVYIDQLDIKIALLVKNKITLDEVIKHQKHFGGHVGNLLSNRDVVTSKDPFDLKALNKNSRRKLEHYQELFFILQTQPQYLARLFKKFREQAMPEQECKRMELLMIGLFGFAQKRREEYYLLKLISRSIKEEIDSCNSIQEYLRGNFFWTRILTNYIRSPRDRKYLRDLLGPIIKEDIVETEGLDLESDPMQIYRSIINNEELRTGQRSRRVPDVPREEAIRDPETRETFIRHLQDLRDIADHFFHQMEDQIHRMPYGIRFIAQQTFELLCQRFPSEPKEGILQLMGNWVWKTYLYPALTQPENWSVVDRGLSPMHKRNLGEVAKVVGQIANGRLFGGDNVYLQPMNPYISDSLPRMANIWESMITIREAEAHFDIDEFNDLYARTKPTLYVKLTDIFAIHQLIAQDVSFLTGGQDDALREVIRELGSPKNNESEMIGVSSTEITLTLNPKLHDMEDPDAALKSLFMETKRCILYIIRVQTGGSLLEIMVRPISAEDDDRWTALVSEEVAQKERDRRRHRRHTNTSTSDAMSTTGHATSALDITALTYAELKRTALENFVTLERHGRLSRHNNYQDLLNSIALDIRTKHRRRIQRTRELEGVKATLAALDEKSEWLDSQLKSYNDYIEQAMITLQNKKGKKRFLLPFTKQYNHEKELQRAGRVPKFGSFKYSAQNLANKGVLVSWKGYHERQWEKINITISSDQVGVFHVEGSVGSMMIPGASAMVPLDDLLQAQFNNCQFVNLFGTSGNDATGGKGGEGSLRLNVNLLVHLLMRKFYRDE
ncbi:RasGAP-like protein [Eremomyces bilateralis CBS 781.70]|uniref:RasGAP-like protein n=1 Tax=Eremomyces bilateralis CBS 781.70 TaxID=1392243 RepID=A0A6G1FY76_9PEZI|nr:RasGAP-like protein [Eremomyces bilateralis CBS 781.70]KAF1810753.1 RasGAP-like protein [Eremomyces bilateralis CBS 781.70]